MAARDFYQTLYQNESLFRLAGETWNIVTPAAKPAVLDKHALLLDTADLLTELDTLSAGSLADVAQPLAVDVVMDEHVIVVAIPQPEPVVLAAKPEPLPQPPSRPVYAFCVAPRSATTPVTPTEP